jgi:ubiquinone/menaquinone biosynthesis C-methylase UbiE
MSTSPLELDNIIIPKIEGSSILDIGAGYGKWGFLSKKYYWQISGNYETQPVVAGIDIFLPHLKSLKRMDSYDFLVNSDAANIPFKDHSFDTIIAAEIIEHMKKEDGFRFVSEIKRVAKKRVIVTTPNFKSIRPGHIGIDGFNKFEGHLSFWSVSELQRLGFKCYGVGLKFSIHPLIYTTFHSLTYKLPRLSQYIVGVMDIH